MNADPARQKQAVGRITIVREPSPLLYAALHYTIKDHFDMDRIFEMLEANNKTKAFPHILGQIPRHTAIRSSSRLNILQSSAMNAYPRNGRSQMKHGGRPKPMYLSADVAPCRVISRGKAHVNDQAQRKEKPFGTT